MTQSTLPEEEAMPIRLHVRPQDFPMTGAEFRKMHPPFAVALDGYVGEGPWVDLDGPYANFNHHEGVYRPATRATCGQVLVEIRQGLFDTFRDENGPRLDAYVNDCDEDVCTAWFLLKHHHMVLHAMNPTLNRLVAMEDMLDTTAGAYPYPKDLPALRELAWVFDPYRRFRLAGGVDRKNADEFRGIITDVEHRITLYIAGRGERISLDLRYERIGGGAGWTMVREVGAHARTAMFADGIRLFAAVRDRADGAKTVTIGKMSGYVRCDLGQVADACNAHEAAARGIASDTLRDRWGGGTTVIGSPRVSGTILPLETIAADMNANVGRP